MSSHGNEPDAVDGHVDATVESYVEDLQRLVAQPSVSATGEGIQECAELLVSLCDRYGFDEVDIVETAGHPTVLARADANHHPENAPTVLLYGHYDTQPVEPEAWETDPFDPVVRERNGERFVYGRGTVDNKGQHLAHVAAVRSLRETGGLPVNVTLLLDGEEESGSPNLMDAVRARESDLDADVSLNADGPVQDSGRPVVVLGNRGILVVDVEVTGPDGDLHSGHYGGAVPNPAWELTRLLGTLRDPHGRVAVDGFYDDVRSVTDADQELLSELERDPEELAADLGVAGFQDGPGETFLERTLFYPSLNINGLNGGHAGEGFKTIVPQTVSVTIDARLVADQDPDEVYRRLERHVETHADDRLAVSVSRGPSMDPLRTPVDVRYREPVVAAVRKGWNEAPVVKPVTGGSAPYAVFANYLGLPHLSVPYGQPDNNQHSPDEHFSLDHFERGIRTSAQLFHAIKRDNQVRDT